MTLKTLADFKRFLARPGATVQVIRNDWMDATRTSHPIPGIPGYWDPKQVEKVQSNCVRFTTGSYLTFPKASQIRCAGDVVEICMQQDGTFSQVLAYRCTEGEP